MCLENGCYLVFLTHAMVIWRHDWIQLNNVQHEICPVLCVIIKKFVLVGIAYHNRGASLVRHMLMKTGLLSNGPCILATEKETCWALQET